MLLRALLIAFSVPALLLAASDPPKADKRARNEGLFTNGVVRLVQIEIPPENVAALKKDARAFVSCTFREGGTTYTNVAVRLKGVGSFRPIDQKPSMSFKFNKWVPRQEFYGLSRIALNNSVQDPSYINEALCTQSFRDIGVPAARVTHAWVHLNGREVGLYVLVEGINKDFLRRHFKSDSGNLYEGYTQDIEEDLDQDNGEDISQSDLRALARAAREPNPKERWERLNKLMDIDRFLSMMAGEILTTHWDGYWINKNNYRIYHDPATDRMVMFPHGLDNMFQQPTWSWRPTMSGLLTRALLLTSEGQRRYRERISSILTNEFRAEILTNRVTELSAKIRPVIAERNASALKDWEQHVSGLRERIGARIKSVSDQLAALKHPLKFDGKGVAILDGWKSQIDAGKPECTQAANILKIRQSGAGAGMASWRARAVLDPGKYRFEGKVKVLEVLPANRSDVGAMLRVSGSKVVPQVRSASDWRPVSYDFVVQFPSDQVELVCELQCLVGETWFDAASMRLVRLP
ncbi:MAG TPA: CotH kinase family protein [Verrucomicrobiae bacterium]|nr:CotH kinase family protein [Verrucomicrobiae bacterium]